MKLEDVTLREKGKNQKKKNRPAGSLLGVESEKLEHAIERMVIGLG